MNDTDSTSPTPLEVTQTAMRMFANCGYADTKLEAVAKETGMTKRMIHYHFADKKGLYLRALHLALTQVAPPAEVLNRSYAAPVEGMRRFVDALYHAFLDNPDAVRLVIRENMDPVVEDDEAAQLPGANEVTLHVERLLLTGQDAGAFRPGVSALDVLILITSLCFFRVGTAVTAQNVGRMDVTNQRNVDGMRRLVVDAVLSFLTSNIPHSGYASYVELFSTADDEAAPQDGVYDVYSDNGAVV